MTLKSEDIFRKFLREQNVAQPAWGLWKSGGKQSFDPNLAQQNYPVVIPLF
jgi:hypothetical protein